MLSCSTSRVDDDSACGRGVLALGCDLFRDITCSGQPDQEPPTCPTMCGQDLDRDPAAHCDGGVCLPNVTDSLYCDEDSDCESGHCDGGVCCAGGACCRTASDCPALFGADPVCDDTRSCQGHRAEARCDDGACVLDLPDGAGCDELSDCASGHCQNGFCCAAGDCCAVVADCPASYAAAAACLDPAACQGSRVDATCAANVCGSVTLNDDRGCTPDVVASDCGLHPAVFCNGAAEQSAPPCDTACTDDSQCDDGAHCDDVCVADLGSGESCNEDSDCRTRHCANHFCCDEGDCCDVAASCPAAYTTAPTCDDPAACQGYRREPTCDDFECGAEVFQDDSGCTPATVADGCGAYLAVTCTGAAEQAGPPDCPETCGSDADCDGGAHCDGGCVSDGDDGDPCDENSDCASNHCANGFCCASGTCCAAVGDCPAAFRTAPQCVDAANCQGVRVDATCAANVCGSTPPIDDDSACTPATVASGCGFYPSVSCSGAAVQGTPPCADACLSDAVCDTSAHCTSAGECRPDLPDGAACEEDSDCVHGHCQNGFCCNAPSGDCCGTAAHCPAAYATAPICGGPGTCQGQRGDPVCVDHVCATAAVDDDSACTAAIVFSDCGPYGTVFCSGATNQPEPSCPANCSGDAQCDEVAHCDGVCELDRPDGEGCNEPSDCESGYCEGGFCCGSGACCETPGEVRTTPCGDCGTRSRTCGANHIWSAWGDCGGQGVCTPLQTQELPCGIRCGTQSRTCTAACEWTGWGSCQNEGPCSEGQVQSEP